ncbi:neprosin family prolyl endopeptidase [Kitasatospora sp. GP82]|uniref:neprosin family prolyl endopeptidase n=1 Tax=Kitasatospora sp. GP82 TaxID=3035089 RepID=UPI002473D45B|nr:neprosin family prolyl endopeptidase [Kitasatospora sp. GP82]MDH6128278.1 hypothetical protein [Kitasatospora sp. GP82]
MILPSPASILGGARYETEVSWYLFAGNWRLYLGGTGASDAVGYYPASLFGGGQLAGNAVDIDYGGEVVDATAWPPMGSGAFADAGWQFAAYHRDVYCFPTTGGGQEASSANPQLSRYALDQRTLAPRPVEHPQVSHRRLGRPLPPPPSSGP